MQYEPMKDRILTLINVLPGFRRIFYYLLDRLLLRQMYVKHYIIKYYDKHDSFHVYDAGAGYCQYSDFILSRWPYTSVLATDLKPHYLESYALDISSKFAGRFIYKHADLQFYRPQRRFDLILAIDVLEHIADDQGVLKIFFDSLKDKGKLIISTPSAWDEAAEFTEEHIRPGYDMDNLVNKLRDCGFKINDSSYTYGWWGHVSWLLLIKCPLKLLHRSNYLVLLLPLYYALVYPLAWLMMKLDFKAKKTKGTGILIVAEKVD